MPPVLVPPTASPVQYSLEGDWTSTTANRSPTAIRAIATPVDGRVSHSFSAAFGSVRTGSHIPFHGPPSWAATLRNRDGLLPFGWVIDATPLPVPAPHSSALRTDGARVALITAPSLTHPSDGGRSLPAAGPGWVSGRALPRPRSC